MQFQLCKKEAYKKSSFDAIRTHASWILVGQLYQLTQLYAAAL